MIKKINAAYEILSDDDKKRKYDKTDFETELDEEEIRSNVQHNVSETNRIYSNYESNSRNYDASDKQYDYRKKYTKVQSTASNFLDTPKGRFQITIEDSLLLGIWQL